MTWPETIELPRAEDFCKGALMRGGRRCSYGHRIDLFGTLSVKEAGEFTAAWHTAADEVGIIRVSAHGLVPRQDHPDTTLTQLAAAFEGA